jgi:HPt (histidine-containing phosphotransfer) domain-containing protein
MTGKEFDLDSALAVLRATYQTRLPAIMQELSDLVGRIGQAPNSGQAGEVIGQLRELAHKLAGGAGTFGFPELGKKARALELFCEPLLTEDRKPRPEELAELDALFAALREEKI